MQYLQLSGQDTGTLIQPTHIRTSAESVQQSESQESPAVKSGSRANFGLLITI